MSWKFQAIFLAALAFLGGTFLGCGVKGAPTPYTETYPEVSPTPSPVPSPNATPTAKTVQPSPSPTPKKKKKE